MGLKDSTTPVATYYPDDLVTLLAKFKTVAIDGNDVTVRYVEGTNDLAQSWKMQLDLGQQAWGGPPAAGSERVITQPLVVGGIVFFTTFIPDENICAGAGETWVFALDYNSGLAPTSPVFDINGDGNFDDGDMVTVDGQPVIPVGIKVGRGQGSNPVIHKDTLFITTTGDGDDGGGSGNPEEDFFAKKINLPDKRVRMESWKLN
jgi:Tfp pilus tip-associated adhesin PilY1